MPNFHNYDMLTKILLIIGMALFIGVVAYSVLIFQGWLFMLAWNVTVPAMFGGPVIAWKVGTYAVVLLNLIGASIRTTVKRK